MNLSASPAPWRFVAASDGSQYFEVLDALGGPVYRGPDEEVARLIAAAPELLAALKEATDTVNLCVEFADEEAGNAAVRRYQALIARIEGHAFSSGTAPSDLDGTT